MLRDSGDFRTVPDREIFGADRDGRVFAEWCETMGLSASVRRVTRAQYREWVRDARAPTDAILVPERPSLGEVPALLSRLLHHAPADRLSRAALRRLRTEIDGAVLELSARIVSSPHPRPLKRAIGRYRRLGAALERAAPGTESGRQLELRSERRESAEATVRLLDTRIARACLEAFFEAFVAHARRTLALCATNLTRAQADVLLRADRSIGKESFFRCGRHELSVRTYRLADVLGLPRADGDAPMDVDRVLRSLTLELAAYPWEAESDGANA